MNAALRFALLVLAGPIAAVAAVIPEEGAVYLEQIGVKPVKVRVARTAPIFYRADLRRYLGTLSLGQLVEVQAIG